MADSPAFQFYPDKWESHTGHLSDYAYRIYHRIICWMWQHSEDQCSIPSDPGFIAVAMREQCGSIETALHEIQNPNFPLLRIVGDDGERFLSRGLQKEVEKQKTRRKQAKKAADKRWGNVNNNQCVSNAGASNQQCTPSPSPSPTPYDSSNTPAKPKSPNPRFKPPEPSEVTAYARSIDFDLDGSQFCDWYASKGWMIGKNKMKDWKAAVRTWKAKSDRQTGRGKTLDELMAERTGS